MIPFALLRTDLSLSRVESYLSLLSYVAFVAWVIAESVGITAVIRINGG